jgi:hypothetical protein
MIIGLCGFISAGKDTVADYLVDSYGFRRESFANTLKDAVAAVFGWDRILLEGRTAQAREWREQVDPWWAERLVIPGLTPRWVLQQWGTEVCRRGFHDDIWIASVENKLRKSTDNIVISDCRFPNEINAIKQASGQVVWIQRGITPHWYDIAVQANKGSESARRFLAEQNIHASETAWAGTNFDSILDNNKTIAHLYQQVRNLVPDLQPPMVIENDKLPAGSSNISF